MRIRGARKVESQMLFEYDDTADNRQMTIVNLGIVFKKAGAYILNMGTVNFFEYLIINLMLNVHVAKN